MYEFVKDWQAYRVGARVSADTLGGGVTDVLLKRGILRAAEPSIKGPPKKPARK